MRSQSPGARAVVFVDADNTLWDTDGVYADAQLALLEGVEQNLQVGPVPENRLAFVRSIDQGLARKHHLGLRYPTRLLADALGRVLAGGDVERVIHAVWMGFAADASLEPSVIETLELRFISDLRRRPDLLPGVQNGLSRLHTSGATTLVVTEGARKRVVVTASELGLERFFDRIIEARKTAQLYTRVTRLVRPAEPPFMIGDQLDRDIAPAKAAGLRTIYVPSRFRPSWEPSEGTVAPTFSAARFDEAVNWVLDDSRLA